MQWIAPKQTPNKSTMKSATKKPPLRSSAQNFGTLPSRLKSTSLSWIPIINLNIVSKAQAFADSLPSQFLRLWDSFSELGLRLHWLRFSEHSNRPINIDRLIPPEDVCHEIHGGIRKRDGFQMCDWKVFNGSCNALHTTFGTGRKI